MKLELYYRPTCPFCRKVLDFMTKHHVGGIELKDIGEAAHQQALIKIGGKSQVPCLFRDGTPLYESDDILQWLKNHS